MKSKNPSKIKKISRRGKTAWVTKNLFGKTIVVSGSTSGGIKRASMKYNAAKGAVNSGMGSRKKRTGRLTGGGF